MLDAADAVLSVVPPEAALDVAAALAAAASDLSAAPLVADLNAVSPATARRIEEVLREAGLELVDGSISGPPPTAPGTTRVYLSGARAARDRRAARGGSRAYGSSARRWGSRPP